ncbi:hypothetical protein LTR10_015027 [Elasticomyces elasticus]|nr:hypothetical protein LTR10_015027 [Elasticomyces elasticus]KAK4964603.1 hypothetical protein LTR42_012901 [Elasticomyces elasticus]
MPRKNQQPSAAMLETKKKKKKEVYEAKKKAAAAAAAAATVPSASVVGGAAAPVPVRGSLTSHSGDAVAPEPSPFASVGEPPAKRSRLTIADLLATPTKASQQQTRLPSPASPTCSSKVASAENDVGHVSDGSKCAALSGGVMDGYKVERLGLE